MNNSKKARNRGALLLTKMPRCTRIMMLYCTEDCSKAVFLPGIRCGYAGVAQWQSVGFPSR